MNGRNENRSPDASLEALLTRHFGFHQFHPGQREPIEAVLNGEDAVVIMPTGSGKSLCYQLAAMAMDGIVLVVSPLISLMKDQVDGLAERGLQAVSLNSSMTSDEASLRISNLRNGRVKLLYVAPERFRSKGFQNLLADLNVTMLAVDEAHCISQWGHDFRPDYMRLGAVLKQLPNARVMALTATATPEVREDIVKQLGLGMNGRHAPRVFVRGFRRDNLRLLVSPSSTHADKLNGIVRVLPVFPTGIIYCSTRKQVERVGEMLREEKVKHLIYHAGLTVEQRRISQDRFMGGEFPVAVATNAFGMGVDRSDLRFVLHWDIPGSIEAYYQEVGRAGRDGATAHCEILYNYADVRTQQFFLDGSNPDASTIKGVWREVSRLLGDSLRTCSLDEWGELVSATDNKIALHTCMGIYERCGLIHREVADGRRCYTTALSPHADPQRLQELLPTLDEKRQRDMRKLDLMLRYVNSRSCRHHFILKYFGEKTDVGSSCRNCDWCGFDNSPPPRAPTEDEWLVVQKFLSCVGRLNHRFGRNTIIAVATGSTASDIIERGLDKVPTYGILSGTRPDYLRKLFEELVRVGAIAVDADQYALAALTAHGMKVAWRKEPLALHWPSAAQVKQAHRNAPSARPDRARRKSDSRAKTSSVVRVLTADEDRIFIALKEWRREESSLREVPAYVVLSDATLRLLAVEQPNTLEEMTGVKGIGPAKLEAYGAAVLGVIRAHTARP